jgi:inositol 1,4,5-triphosphate receptor type 1
VSGIIIDTFAELRGMKQSIESEVLNVCYICNIVREDFEQSESSFADHVQNDHNMWKYLWYIIYLEERSAMEYTGVGILSHYLLLFFIYY